MLFVDGRVSDEGVLDYVVFAFFEGISTVCTVERKIILSEHDDVFKEKCLWMNKW